MSKLATKAISNIKVNRYFIYHNTYSTNSYKNLPKHIRRYYLLLLLLFIFTIIIKTESVIINTLCISTYYFNGKIQFELNLVFMYLSSYSSKSLFSNSIMVLFYITLNFLASSLLLSTEIWYLIPLQSSIYPFKFIH